MEFAKPINQSFLLVELSKLEKSIAGFLPVPARIFLAAIFIWSGLGKIPGWEHTAGYMASRGMPLIPFFLLMAIILEVGGGISVILGLKARLGALALALYLIPTTLIFHNFWTFPAQEQFLQMIMFMKNAAIIGGLLMVAAFGAGGYSLDSRMKNNRRRS